MVGRISAREIRDAPDPQLQQHSFEPEDFAAIPLPADYSRTKRLGSLSLDRHEATNRALPSGEVSIHERSRRLCSHDGSAAALKLMLCRTHRSATAWEMNLRHHQITMTFKIKAADLKRMEEGLDMLSTQRVRLGHAVGVFNEALVCACATLQAAVDDYNQQGRDVRAAFENVYRPLEKPYAERSDDWKDGEKGTAVKEWLDTLESFPENIVDVSLDEFIDELELEDLVGDDPRDDFKDVGQEPGEA
ncbi:hypothetical protein [Caballeronia sp. PC1]|uniref:hypothetical protein n=2 Tax=unclassified Caballeronia TaxID=2646786 RepID=UPI001F458977|nr:hypothetical protein [Caballeronia sp. PC1]MCE4547400.1 hypothetical protein [Caballeronia sp. PC1]